ncbi:MAG TPA: ABC transporter substrate-binding protein [Acidimicrobiia bacterium]|nr:ABC transporter substrate-binding protein [Acidimicrobiia bacterium]
MGDERGLTRREALKRAGLLAGAALVGGPALTGCGIGLEDQAAAGSGGSKKKAPVLLGIVDSRSGTFAASGASQIAGAQLAVDELNDAGGILGGRRIEVRIRDDATKADIGARGARELIGQENVDVIVGGVSSAVGLAVSEACSQLGCPLVLAGTHDDTITGKSAHRTTFRAAAESIMIARVVVGPLMKKTGNRWFFITSDYAYGLGAEKAMIAELTKAGGSVVAAEHTPLGTTDFSAQLTKARGSGATTVVLVLYGADLIAASKQYNEFGLNGKIGIGGHLNGLEMAVGIGPDRVHGIFGTPWNADVDTPASKKFIGDIKRRTGQTANFRHYLGYLAAREALQGLDRAGTTAPEAWVKAMEGHHFDTLKENRGYWREWDHQAIHDPLAIEAIPRADWKFDNEYFKTIARADGDKVAPTRADNAIGADRIRSEKIAARPGYSPKEA